MDHPLGREHAALPCEDGQRLHVRDRIRECADVRGRRAAAAADDAGAGRDELLCLLRELLRRRAVDSLSVDEFRQTVVRLCDDRDIRIFVHGLHDGGHFLRTGRAVDADGIDAHTLQNDRDAFRRRAVEGPAVLLEGHRHEDGQVICLTDREHGGAALLEAHHRFDDVHVDACLLEDLRLLLVDIDELLKAEIAHRVELAAGHRHVARDKCTAADCLAGEADEVRVHLREFVVQAVLRELDPVCGKCRRVHNI